jgi:hypothetical protein
MSAKAYDTLHSPGIRRRWQAKTAVTPRISSHYTQLAGRLTSEGGVQVAQFRQLAHGISPGLQLLSPDDGIVPKLLCDNNLSCKHLQVFEKKKGGG